MLKIHIYLFLHALADVCTLQVLLFHVFLSHISYYDTVKVPKL